MGLSNFMEKDKTKEKVQQIFKNGVRMIYQDALTYLLSNEDLIDKLISMQNIPSEITSTYLENLKAGKAPILTQTEEAKVIREQISVKDAAYKLIKNYSDWEPVTRESFVSYFNSRYRAISQMLWRRPQMKNTLSISQLSRVRTKEELSLIVMVREIRDLEDGRRFLTVEDLSGTTTVLVSTQVVARGELVLDEVIGIKGFPGRGLFFANEIIFPEINYTQWPLAPRSKVVFISDLHVGSKKFMEELWERFVSWLKEHKEVKYVFVAGDLVDGVGMYYKQNEDLEIDTFENQMEAFARYMKQIRSDVKIFVISGNHDPNRDSEPQPIFPDEIGKPLKNIDNLEVFSNPAWINVEGITILMYHGTSFDGLISAIEPIRSEGYHKPYLAQKYLLKKRHLSPIFGRNKIFPDKKDFLVIDKVPNVFHTGHIHNVGISEYKGVKLVSSGTFQNVTDFQEKLGHEPTPGKFVVMDLTDGKTLILDLSQVQ